MYKPYNSICSCRDFLHRPYKMTSLVIAAKTLFNLWFIGTFIPYPITHLTLCVILPMLNQIYILTRSVVIDGIQCLGRKAGTKPRAGNDILHPYTSNGG